MSLDVWIVPEVVRTWQLIARLQMKIAETSRSRFEGADARVLLFLHGDAIHVHNIGNGYQTKRNVIKGRSRQTAL